MGGTANHEMELNQQGTMGSFAKEWDHDYCRTSPGSTEWSSRQGIQEEELKQMEIRFANFSEYMLGQKASRDLFASRVSTQLKNSFLGD